MVTSTSGLDREIVLDALRDVHDPEIPAISVVDLGVIGRIDVDADSVGVELMPTFIGCPAIEVMRTAIAERLGTVAGGRTVDVRLGFAEPWTSDRITAEGRRALTASGFAPPTAAPSSDTLLALELPVPCPYCGSRRTVLENSFGPTACRSIRYCSDCRQPFEHFKTV